jgi:hypothetical protein
MKATCVCSHRETGDEGKYKDYIAGKVYEFPDGQELGPNFAPYFELPATLEKKEGE